MKTISKILNAGVRILLPVMCTLNFYSQNTSAQNVGIGASSFTPNASAMLDISATNKGLLIPRVALSATSSNSPIGASVATSLLVYNTATAGISPNNVTPGYYYWDGIKWVTMGSTGNWSLTGNASTNAVSNFIGTTDANDFVVRTNNIERIRINSSGNVGIGTTAPTQKLSVATGMNVDNNNTNTGSLTNALLFGGGGTGEGIASKRTVTGNLNGLDFYTNFANRMCITNSGNVGIGTTAPSTKLQVNSAWDGIMVNSAGTGIVVNNAGINPFNWDLQNYGYPGWTSFAGNCGILSGGIGHGLVGQAWDDNNSATDHSGGEFVIQNNPKNNVIAGTNIAACLGGTIYKAVGFGTVSTIVADLENNPRTMSCPETPEVLLQDFGTGQLTNGTVHINLDSIFSKNIKVDAAHIIKIFVQLEGNCNGVFVSNKSSNGFDVTELNSGSSNVKFSWFVSANRANEIIGGSLSDYESFRFKPMKNTMYMNAFKTVNGTK